MIALVLDIYEDNEVITMLSTNEIDEIDKEFKLNLRKFI